MNTSSLVLSDNLYNKAKWFVQIVLPAISTLYFTLSALYDLPAVEQVMGTCAALAVFLGALLGFSTKSYNASDAKYDGEVLYSRDEDGTVNLSKIGVNEDNFEDVVAKKELVLKIRSNPA